MDSGQILKKRWAIKSRIKRVQAALTEPVINSETAIYQLIHRRQRGFAHTSST
jgi:hypothetical protein